MTSVGSNIPRLDGRDKVTGRALYIDDLVLPGMLHAWTVRSEVPCGRIEGVRFDPAFDWSDIVTVTAADIAPLGRENVIALIDDDQPCLADREIRHADEPIALVAAPTRDRAEHAARAVYIDVTRQDAVLDPERSSCAFRTLAIGDGDIDDAFARADRIVQATYRTGLQEQLYIEPQGVIAIPRDDGGITIKGSLQCPYYVHKALKRLFGLDDHQVVVIQTVTGGGFGGKEEYPSMIAAHAALLALKSGRPVKMVYERGEDIRATTKRHAAVITHRTAVAADGTLLGADIDVLFDAGAYVTLSPVVLSRGVLHAAGPYRYEAVRIRGRAVFTNTPPAGAFRGFGAPQVTFAYERHMDRIARELGLTPLEIRQKNMMRRGDKTPTGQIMDVSFGGEAVLESTLAISRYAERVAEPRAEERGADGSRRRRGIGLSYFFHGAGFTGNGEAKIKGKVALELAPGGRVRILTASTDIGQGTMTVFPQIAAETIGISVDCVEVAPPDTSSAPDSGPTVASRTVMVVGKVVQDAAEELKRIVEAFLPNAPFAEAADALLAARGAVRVDTTFKSPPELKWDDATYRGDAYPCFAWAAEVVEVTVDLDTAEVAVMSLQTAQDVGKAIHPILAEGQIEGGTVQALGWATMEEVVMRDGRVANARMTNYIIPTTLDVPDLTVVLIEVPYPYGPFGAKGIGELPMDGGAPAVLAAIEHALGVPIPDIVPLTPEKLLPSLGEMK